MAYESTIVGRSPRNNPRTATIPKEVYITPDILKTIWKPLEVSRAQEIYTYIAKPFADLIKASAIHIKEGLTYESRGAVWNNPLRPVEISDWGELNNYGGGNAATRDANFAVAMTAEKKRLEALYRRELGARPASNKKEQQAWNKRVRNMPSQNSMPAPSSQKGHQYMPVIFKRTGYFVAPKFSTLELRNDIATYKKGKGEEYIELDGLIHFVKKSGNTMRHKFVIIELKKEKGATGASDAEQMRKAAALLRKWGYELNGVVPSVELYFASGAAERFNANGYNFNSEKNRIQDWTPRQIQNAVASSPNHIAYIRTPVFLLTGIGFAEFLRIHPDRFSAIRSALTEASSLTGSLKVFQERHIKPIDRIIRDFLLVKDGKIFRPPTEEEVNGREQLYIDLFKLATDPDNEIAEEFQAHLPQHWKIQSKNVHPTLGLARVAEHAAFIQHMEAKLNRPNLSSNKKNEIKKEIITHYKYILSPKYVKYLKNADTWRSRLQELNSSARVNAPVNSPTRNPRFYKKVLKSRQTARVMATKRIGPWRYVSGLVPAKNVKVGYKMVGVENVLPEYLFKKGRNINFGNVTAANINQVKDSQVIRWIEYIGSKMKQPKTINKNNWNKFNSILRGAINSRSKPVGANVPANKRAAVQAKRKNVANLARNTLANLNREKAIRSGGGPSAAAPSGQPAQSERELKQKILNKARSTLNESSFKQSFPAGVSSVPAYVKRVTGSKIANLPAFIRNMNTPGVVSASPAARK
jgi:hypothetical protein